MTAPGPTDHDVVVATPAEIVVVEPTRGDQAALLVAAVVSLAVAAALWATAQVSEIAVVVVVAVVQASLIGAWLVGMRVPGRWGGLVVCAAAAAASDVLCVVFDDDQLRPLLPPLGLLILAVFVAQLFRGVVRLRLVESVSDIALVGLAVIALPSLVQLRQGLTGETQLQAVAVILGAGLVLAALADIAAPLPRFDPAVPRGLIAVVLAGVGGGLAGWFVLRDTFGYGPARGAFLGAALGVVAALIAVGGAFASRRATVTTAVTAGDAVNTVEVEVDTAAVAESDPVAGEREIVIEQDVRPFRPETAWSARLVPIATSLWTFAIAAPVGYLLALALGG